MPKVHCEEIYSGLLDNPLQFLRSNVIVADGRAQNDYPTNASRLFDFEVTGLTTQGGKVYEHIAVGHQTINGHLEVTYLPYGINAGYYVIMESQGGPSIMMTAQLSGCSVGYMKVGDGAIRVSHHNVQVMSVDPNQGQRRSLSFADSALHPNQYRDVKDGNQGNYTFRAESVGYVVGVRRDRRWTMYAQIVIRRWKRHNSDNLDRTSTVAIYSVTGF
jgi:hypothetical protein